MLAFPDSNYDGFKVKSQSTLRLGTYFHSLIKREWLNRFKIRDYDHAYRLIFEYLEAFYNTKRIHSHCDYMSPNDYEELYHRLQQGELQMAG